MIFKKSQPVETGHKRISSASAGLLENIDSSPPARKAHAREIHEKVGSIPNTCELPWPAWGDMKKKLTTKPMRGRTAPVCSV
jgi:hypothetical protein